MLLRSHSAAAGIAMVANVAPPIASTAGKKALRRRGNHNTTGDPFPKTNGLPLSTCMFDDKGASWYQSYAFCHKGRPFGFNRGVQTAYWLSGSGRKWMRDSPGRRRTAFSSTLSKLPTNCMEKRFSAELATRHSPRKPKIVPVKVPAPILSQVPCPGLPTTVATGRSLNIGPSLLVMLPS